MKMFVVICDRNLTGKVIKLLNESEINYHVSFYGRGTADNEILSYFGLAKSEKEVIISFVSKEKIKLMMTKLTSEQMIKHHGAVAFSVPLDAISKNTKEFITQIGG